MQKLGGLSKLHTEQSAAMPKGESVRMSIGQLRPAQSAVAMLALQQVAMAASLHCSVNTTERYAGQESFQ